jgi:hypothetical protein
MPSWLEHLTALSAFEWEAMVCPSSQGFSMRATPARAGADPTPLPESLARVSSWLGDGAMQADEPLVVLARARLASTQKKRASPQKTPRHDARPPQAD